jgi:hypothetical protein
MSDANRRTRLLELFNGPRFNGDRSALIAETGLTKGRVAQFFNPAQPFGERAAANLAERLGLPASYFDAESGPYQRAIEWIASSDVRVAVPLVAHAFQVPHTKVLRDVREARASLTKLAAAAPGAR